MQAAYDDLSRARSDSRNHVRDGSKSASSEVVSVSFQNGEPSDCRLIRSIFGMP